MNRTPNLPKYYADFHVSIGRYPLNPTMIWIMRTFNTILNRGIGAKIELMVPTWETLRSYQTRMQRGDPDLPKNIPEFRVVLTSHDPEPLSAIREEMVKFLRPFDYLLSDTISDHDPQAEAICPQPGQVSDE